MSFSIKREVQNTLAELYPKAESGDLDSMFHIFVLLNAQAMGDLDFSIFDKAEKYLIKSAEGGHFEAVESLSHQEFRRNAFER